MNINGQPPETSTGDSKLLVAPQTAESEHAEGLIDSAECARRLTISEPTLFNWRKQGLVPYVKVGARVLFHWPSVLETMLRNQRKAAA